MNQEGVPPQLLKLLLGDRDQVIPPPRLWESQVGERIHRTESVAQRVAEHRAHHFDIRARLTKRPIVCGRSINVSKPHPPAKSRLNAFSAYVYVRFVAPAARG
jgi:hypothetical protein